VSYFLEGEPGESGDIPITVGTADAEPKPIIELAGLGIARDHALIMVRAAALAPR
jgi:hypothetical protein